MPITAPIGFAAWLACLVFSVMLFNACSKAWFTLRGRPSPSESLAATNALAARIAVIETCINGCKPEQDRRIDILEKNQVELSNLILDQINKLYNRLNPTAETLAGLEGEMKAINTQLTFLLTLKQTQKRRR
ncbi:MAG: hypothetical protein PHI93_10970 [Kiritimatiellae bacterium]|nr:hypothetical protein [Kiritimatiellia bacterium]